MIRVKLIDIDNKYRESKRRGIPFPNLALMKLSAYHKARGDLVGFEIENPDITHISCIFTKNRLYAIKECCDVKGGISFGGSGLSLDFDLPPQIEFMKPDYDLYPHWLTDKKGQTSIGFSSRGCPRRCGFCLVHEKEGHFRRHQHIREFHDNRFKAVTLLDNNILADKEWFFEQTDWIIDHKLKLDISQGMDIRLLTDEIAEQLHRIKFIDQQMRFAWDTLELEPVVKAGIEMLRDHGINTKRNVSFFVLSGWNDVPFCKDVYRCNRLKEFGALPYVMPWKGGTPMIRALARWANRVRPFKAGPFYRYERMPRPPAPSPQQEQDPEQQQETRRRDEQG
jgi:hypothetical protein